MRFLVTVWFIGLLANSQLVIQVLDTRTVHAQGVPTIPAPNVAEIRRLPVTTHGFGNTLVRGNTFQDRSQTWMQLYTNDMAVTSDGFVFLTTGWEEGLRAAGIYKNGDALPELTGLGVNSGQAVAASDQHVAYARWLNTKDRGKQKEIVVFQRTEGQPLDPQSRRNAFLAEQTDTIYGLALDESRERLYFADDAGVRAVSLKNLQPIANFKIPLPRAGRMTLDSAGNLWVVQRPLPASFVAISATPFGSEPADAEHGVEQAAADVHDYKTFFLAKDVEAGFIGLDFGQAVDVATLRLQGNAGDDRFREVRIEASTAGRNGPWREVARLHDKLYDFPDEYLTFGDVGKSVKAIRIVGPKLKVFRLRAFARSADLPGKIAKFSPEGHSLPQAITTIAQPTDIAFDSKHDRLLVGDYGTDNQVHAFTNLNTTPIRDRGFLNDGRLGVARGRRAGTGKERGTVGPSRLEHLRGVGVDRDGNLYVCSVGDAGMCQSALHCFGVDGQPKWELQGTSFLDTVDADPQQPADWFSTFNHYRHEPGEASGVTRWIASTVDRRRFPDDPRVQGNALTYGVRRLHGAKFLITTTQHSTPLCVMRFVDNDEAALPCGLILNRHSGRPWPPHQPLGFGATIWRDRNGDGQFDANEYDKALRDDSDMMYPNIDDAGDLWFFNRVKAKRYVRKLALAPRLDEHGSPIWRWDAPENGRYELPAPLNENKSRFGGMEVDGVRGEVFLFGFPVDRPNECGHNWPLGRFMQRCVIQGDQLVATHSAELPHNVVLDTATKDQAYGAALCGEYLFVAFQQHFTVLVYRRANLALVGRLDLGPQVLKPLMDGQHELVVRPDGDGFVMFTPHYVANAIAVRRWNGQTNGWLPTPGPSLKHENGLLAIHWPAFSDAHVVKQWRLERRDLRPTGWSDWSPHVTLEGAEREVTMPHEPNAPASAFRLRAIGENGALSDWSATVYVR